MNNIKNKIKLAVAVAVAGMGLNSCSLDMLPLNDVVLENYWTNKSDVESVVSSCYVGMQENGYLTQLIVWGEDRSDNVVPGTKSTPSALTNLMKGSLKTTNTYCNWSAMYNVINRCNTVLYYAPKVAEQDPNYTESDLRINIAECKALRAISYLTLIKTFKDVPFSLEPTIDDDQEIRLGQTKFEVILDSLIADIEGCKDDAPRKYSTKEYNTAKITRAAMYSILAELYLWRASDYQLTASQQNEYYKKCVEACDWVLNFKIQQYENEEVENQTLSKYVDTEVWSTYGYPLLSETLKDENQNNAFDAIFGKGNSFESIFELTYAPTSVSDGKTNSDVGLMYGGHNSSGTEVQYVMANEDLLTNATSLGTTFANTSLFSVGTDFRTVEAFKYTENGNFDIYKYSVANVNSNYTGTSPIVYSTSGNLPNANYRSYSLMYPNWIFYRMTEIMLFRAEAEIEIAGNLDKSAAPEDTTTTTPATSKHRKASVAVNGADLVTATELYDDAFNLISAVYLRSNPSAKDKTAAKPTRANFTNLSDFEDLLMYERQREFLFEAKRYFDLVRISRRAGNTNKFVQTLTSKYGEGGTAIAIKMKQMDFMYMPILKTQMQVNPNLIQNSAYLDEETIQKN